VKEKLRRECEKKEGKPIYFISSLMSIPIKLPTKKFEGKTI